MSWNRLAAGAALALAAAAAPASATEVALQAGQCVDNAWVAVCVPTPGAGLVVPNESLTSLAGGRALMPTCKWTTSAAATTLTTNVTAPGADSVSAMCRFRVDGVETYVPSGQSSRGAATGTHTVGPASVVTACLVSATAKWGTETMSQATAGCNPA